MPKYTKEEERAIRAINETAENFRRGNYKDPQTSDYLLMHAFKPKGIENKKYSSEDEIIADAGKFIREGDLAKQREENRGGKATLLERARGELGSRNTEKREARQTNDAEVRAANAYRKMLEGNTTSDALNLETYSRMPKNSLFMARNMEEAGKAIEAADMEKKREENRGGKATLLERAKGELGLKKGGMVKKPKSKASTASKRADGIAQRGKTRGKMV